VVHILSSKLKNILKLPGELAVVVVEMIFPPHDPSLLISFQALLQMFQESKKKKDVHKCSNRF